MQWSETIYEYRRRPVWQAVMGFAFRRVTELIALCVYISVYLYIYIYIQIYNHVSVLKYKKFLERERVLVH